MLVCSIVIESKKTSNNDHMSQLVIKQLFLVGLVWLLGLMFFFIAGVSVFTLWSIFCLLIFFVFFKGLILLKIWKKKGFTYPGLVFAVFSFFNQLFFLSLLFIFLKPQEYDHRMMAIAGLVGYFICFIADIRWKLRIIQNCDQ